ncbi:hypothetical protein GHT09_009616 [Marmota monax]|uniref:Uncharacterized protein n=1 Tax=Marmota monax TaxID=9995 RepID=A0A834QJ36_MARMO|nr:hypothetical protein GHT09_009616 [Marmota monax]
MLIFKISWVFTKSRKCFCIFKYHLALFLKALRILYKKNLDFSWIARTPKDLTVLIPSEGAYNFVFILFCSPISCKSEAEELFEKILDQYYSSAQLKTLKSGVDYITSQ